MDEVMKDELLSIVKQILDFELQRLEIDTTIQDLRHKSRPLATQAEIKISLEKDENGKVKYTNESVRRAALNLDLQSNTQYRDLENKLNEFHLKDKKLAIMCIDLKARYQVLLAYATLSGGRVSFPSLQLEDLDLLSVDATLSEKIQRLIFSTSNEPKTTILQVSQHAKDRLLSLRSKISELDKHKSDLDARHRKIARQIRIIEDQARLDIVAKKDAKGKLAYSTERTRESAIRLSLENNKEHRQLNDDLLRMDNEIDKLYDELVGLREEERVLLTGDISAHR